MSTRTSSIQPMLYSVTQVATLIGLPGRTAKLLECFEEERFDIVRLQATGFRALHIFSHTGDTAGTEAEVAPFLATQLETNIISD